MEKKTKGAWVIHHTFKIQKMDNQNQFAKIYVAGRAGVLLSALSEQKACDLDNDKVSALAEGAGINELELDGILSKLATHKLIDRGANGISVLGLTTPAILDHVADLYDAQKPRPHEDAAIHIAELTSAEPATKQEASKIMTDQFAISAKDVPNVVQAIEGFGFVDVERLDATTEILFNGNLFRRDEATKIKRVLDSLSEAERRVLTEVCEKMRLVPCMIARDVEHILGKDLHDKLLAIGFFDKTILSNENGNVLYMSLPASFKKYGGSGLTDDPLDLSKEFVASLTYGMQQSSYARGQISMISRLLGNLIAGEWVGPVDAIGQDYKTLELKRAVEVQEFWRTNWQGKRRYGPNLKLLKPEVGELALSAITQGGVSEESLPNLPGAAVTKFSRPEEQREAHRRNQSPENKAAMNNVLMRLRGGKHGR